MERRVTRAEFQAHLQAMQAGEAHEPCMMRSTERITDVLMGVDRGPGAISFWASKIGLMVNDEFRGREVNGGWGLPGLDGHIRPWATLWDIFDEEEAKAAEHGHTLEWVIGTHRRRYALPSETNR